MELVLLSDTHGKHLEMECEIPEGDVLIAAGDISQLGLVEEIVSFNDWLGSLPHQHKILVPGAHDSWCDELPTRAQELLTNCTFLLDSEVIIQGVRFYGTPVQPQFYDWSYQPEREQRLEEVIHQIPIDTDVLVTHVPPYGVCDFEEGKHVGSKALLERVLLVNPYIHVFGHVHDGYGKESREDTVFVNAAICDVGHKPARAPLKFELK